MWKPEFKRHTSQTVQSNKNNVTLKCQMETSVELFVLLICIFVLGHISPKINMREM